MMHKPRNKGCYKTDICGVMSSDVKKSRRNIYFILKNPTQSYHYLEKLGLF